MTQKIEQKQKNSFYITAAIFMMLFIAFFDYLFSYTALSAVKLNYVLVIGVGVISFLVGLYGDIKPMLLWLPFYIFVGAHWWRFRFSVYYFIMYMSTMCFSAFIPYFKENLQKKFIKLMVAFGVFFAVGCLFQEIMNSAYVSLVPRIFNATQRSFILNYNSHGISAGFSYQPTAAAGAITLGIIANWTQFKKNKRSVILQILLYWGLLLTAKRAYFLISIAVPLMMYYYKSKTGKVFRFFLVLVSVVVMIYFYYSVSLKSELVIFQRLGELTTDNVDMNVATSGRGNLLENAILQFKENPLTGIGWGRYSAKYGTATHNVYFQLLCETGLFGLIAFLFSALMMLAKSIKKLKATSDNEKVKEILLLSVGVQFAFLIYAFTGNPLYDTQWIWLYFFMGAVSLTVKPGIVEEKDEKNGNSDVSLRR